MSDNTSTISCDVFSEKLMDFLEGDLDGAMRAAMDAHAHRCAACGALVADVRRLAAEASRLPELAPSRDLWSGISARIEAPVVRLADRRPLWKSPRVVGVAAAAAIVLAAALGYEAAPRTPAPAITTQVAALPAAPADTPTADPIVAGRAIARRTVDSVHAALAANRVANATSAAVEQTYDGEISGLRAIIKQRHGQLDTATVAVLERSLAVIDSAIAQCKTALGKDPHSQFLIQSLSQSLDTKVQLLQMTAGLPSTTE